MAKRNKQEVQPEQTGPVAPAVGETPAATIQRVSRAFRLSFNHLGQKRQLSDQHKASVADKFSTQYDLLDLSKRLFDSKHQAIKDLNKAKAEVVAFFEYRTLPWPENGVRLFPVRRETEEEQTQELSAFVAGVRHRIQSYCNAVDALQNSWHGVIEDARMKLGDLFNAQDYPAKVHTVLGCRFEPVNVELPNYYKHLAPQEYKQACDTLRAKFETAVQLQEQFVAKKFDAAVRQLLSSVVGYHNGEQKCFRNSVVDNVFAALKEFNLKTKAFGIAEGSELEKSVNQVIAMLGKDHRGNNVSPHELADVLRENPDCAAHIAQGLESVGAALASQIRTEKRRNLLRLNLKNVDVE